MQWHNLSVTLRVRIICNFFQELITTAFLPFIALYLSDMTSQTIAGIFLTALVILNFPISILGGYFVEKFPKKKTILLYQLFMSFMLVFMSLTINNDLRNILIFCLCYSVFNIMWSLQYPAMDTVIMDAITPNIENYIYKIDYWLTNIAIALGALLGGIFYNYNKSLLLIISALIFFLVYISLLKWLPKDSAKKNYNTLKISNLFTSYKPVFKDYRFIILSLSFSIIMMGELSASSYISIRLKNEFQPLNFFTINIDGVKMYSLLMVVNTLVVIICTLFISKIVMKFNNKIILIFGLSLYIIGYSSITFLNEFYLLIIFMVIATFGEIIYAPLYEEERFKIIPKEKRGTYSAISSLGFNLSELLARLGILLGVFLTPLGMSVYMLIILSIGGLLMFLSINSNELHNE